MAEAPHAVVEVLDLWIDLVWRAGKTGIALDELLNSGGSMINRVAFTIPNKAGSTGTRFEHCHIRLDQA
jgi:hypothetical protein